MLVKAKWNVKDERGWHMAGEVFDTAEDLGNAVEALEKAKKQKPAATPETPAEAVSAPEKPEEKPKTATRRKKASE